MYKNILIPVIFDKVQAPENAFDVAKILADDGAKITLLHVMEELPGYATSYVAGDFIQQRKKEVKLRIEEWASTIDGGVAAVITGHSGRSILDWIETHGSDCVIISSHKPGLQDYLLGGTAAHVVRHSQCSVHVIR